MDQLQLAELIKQFIADQGITDQTLIRKAALEVAVAFLDLNAPVSTENLIQRTRANWGLDYSLILNEAAVEYENSNLTASEVLREIANRVSDIGF